MWILKIIRDKIDIIHIKFTKIINEKTKRNSIFTKSHEFKKNYSFITNIFNNIPFVFFFTLYNMAQSDSYQ